MRLLLLLAMIAALALGACGGDSDDSTQPQSGREADGGSESDRVRATVDGLYDAMGDRDAEGVCDQLNEAAQEQVAKGGLPGSEGTTCVEGFQAFFEAAEEAGGLDTPDNAEVVDVKVDGDRATATVKFGPGQRGKIPLVKVDGEWKLEAVGANRPSSEASG